ncbi:MAG: hypothetical protein JNM85_07230 [Chthonomonas sp.]|nr:hypothetical protein [Chthonomonas sp.]
MSNLIASVQFAPDKAEVAKNLDRLAKIVRDASEAGAELIVTPETSVTGYYLEGGVLESALTAEALTQELGKRFAGHARPFDVLVGYYESHREDVFNSASYFEWSGTELRCIHTYRKFFLPTYGVFDEERFIARGHELGVFETRFGRVGVLICEDIWHSILPTLAAMAGATILLVPSASPARGFSGPNPGNWERYRRLLIATAEEHSVFCVNSMLCGFEGGKGFVGGGMVVGPNGDVLGQSPIGEEHVLLTEIHFDDVSVSRAGSPLLSDLRSAWSDVVRLASDLR